jgi:predicted component of type VI protein secretion system
MDVKLIVVGGKSAGREISVPGPQFLIGRDEECQLRPGSNLVSRAVVRDFGSRNGTFVNDEPVRNERELKTGDHLKVGPLEFEVQLTVGVGGKKKPKVHSIGEAAARTVQSAAYHPDEDMDIGRLFGEDEVEEETPRVEPPKTAAETIRFEKPTEPTKKFTLAQLGEQKKPATSNSREAAAETLRKFLGKR